MELDAMYVISFMAQCHDLSFLAFCRYFQAVWKTVPAYYPGVVSSDRNFLSQSLKKYILTKDTDRSLYPVIYFFQIFQTCSESLADSLMSQANA